MKQNRYVNVFVSIVLLIGILVVPMNVGAFTQVEVKYNEGNKFEEMYNVAYFSFAGTRGINFDPGGKKILSAKDLAEYSAEPAYLSWLEKNAPRYNSAFFKERFLLIVHLEVSSPTEGYRVTSVYEKDGSLNLGVEYAFGYLSTLTVVSTWTMILEMDIEYVDKEVLVTKLTTRHNQVIMPSASPSSDTLTGVQQVVLSSPTKGADIYYTTDGTMPAYPVPSGSSAQLYTEPLVITSTSTINAIGVKEDMDDSEILTLEIVEANYLVGDIDGDGVVTMADVMAVFNHISGLNALSEESLLAADIDRDGAVTMADFMAMFDYVSGKRAVL